MPHDRGMDNQASHTLFFQQLGETLRSERESQGLSLRKLGLMVNVGYKRIFELEHGEANVTLETIVSIAEGLDIPLSTVFAKAEGRYQEASTERSYAVVSSTGENNARSIDARQPIHIAAVQTASTNNEH